LKSPERKYNSRKCYLVLQQDIQGASSPETPELSPSPYLSLLRGYGDEHNCI